MFGKSDQEFLSLLHDEAMREQRIAELGKTRKSFVIGTIVFLSVLMFTIAIMMYANFRDIVSRNPHPISYTTPILSCFSMCLGSIITVSKAILVHSELRMLLLFKKLRDDKSVAAP